MTTHRPSLLVAISAALAVLAAAPGASADDFAPEIRLSFAGVGIDNPDASVDWVSDSRIMERGEIGVGALVLPGLSVLAEFSHRTRSTWILDSFDNEFTLQTVGVRARYAFEMPFPIVRPYVSGGAGVAIARDRLYGDNATLEARALGFAGDLAAGVEAQTRGRFSVAGYLDAGYAFRSDLRFDDAEPRGDGGPQSAVDLGAVSIRGFQWRAGCFLAARF